MDGVSDASGDLGGRAGWPLTVRGERLERRGLRDTEGWLEIEGL